MSSAPNGTAQEPAPAAVPVRWSARFLVVWLVLMAVWEVLVRSGVELGLFLPAPSRVLLALMALSRDGTLASHLVSTLTRIMAGLMIGGSIGLLLGLAMGTSSRIRQLVDPIVAALHPIPRLAFFPLLIVAFGIGEVSKMAAVSLGAFFPMLLNTVAAVRGINPVHLELAHNYGATRWQLFTRILLPGSLPLMLTGLRLSSNIAFHATIGIEMVGSRQGIGSLLWLSWQTFRIDQLYAVMVIIAVIGIGLASLIRWVTSRTVPWVVDRASGA